MDYLAQFQGRFIGIMQWDKCNALFDTLIDNPSNDWHFYDTTSTVPLSVTSANTLVERLTSIKSIIQDKHKERYCGVVYVDDLKNPTFIKIFNPNNLGKACGSSEHPPIPQWLLSKTPPVDIVAKFAQPPKNQPSFVRKILKL